MGLDWLESWLDTFINSNNGSEWLKVLNGSSWVDFVFQSLTSRSIIKLSIISYISTYLILLYLHLFYDRSLCDRDNISIEVSIRR